MGKRLTNTAPNRFQGGEELIILPGERLVGVLTFETDDGTMELAINRAGAESLVRVLNDFLDGKPTS